MHSLSLLKKYSFFVKLKLFRFELSIKLNWNIFFKTFNLNLIKLMLKTELIKK